MKVELTESASADLKNILQYYLEQGAADQGRRIAGELLKKSERLSKYPDSGRIVPEFGMPYLKEVIVPPFRLVYRRGPNVIWIIRFWRSERLLSLE